MRSPKLWFDVGIKRYTTKKTSDRKEQKLWFDVGIKRYTTDNTVNVERQKLISRWL